MTDQTPALSSPSANGALAVFLRAFWMLLGNMILVLCAFTIAKGQAQFSRADIIYWMTVPLVLAARHVDINRYGGKTAAGERATLSHWRSYAVFLICSTAAAWAVAHGAAIFFANN